MVRIGCLSLLALAAAVGCSDGADRFVPSVEVVDGVQVATVPRVPDPLGNGPRWEFEVVREVPTVDPDGNPIIFDPSRVLELRSGRLFVVDQASDRPLVLIDPENPSSVIAFGSRGRGPGELGVGLSLGELTDGSLTVVDRSNRQVHLFTSSGDWIASHPLAVEVPGDAIKLPGRDSYAMSSLRQEDAAWHRDLLELDPRTGEVSHLLRLPDPTADARPGWTQQGRQLWAVSPHSIVTMWSSRPVVMVHGHDGAPKREVRLPLTQRELTERDISREIELHGDIARRLEVGPVALTNMLYAPGDSIIAMFLAGRWRAAEDPPLPPGQIYWRLFTEGGRYLGVAEVPDDFRYLGVGSGSFWARRLDDELNPVLQQLVLRQAD